MKVEELNREQLIELKQSYLCSQQENTSWGELVCIDSIVPDELIMEAFSGIDFVPDDFDCSTT